MSESRHDFWLETLGPAVRLWVICRYKRALDYEILTNESKRLLYKLRSFVRKYVNWDSKWDYPITKEQVQCLRRISFRRQNHSRQFVKYRSIKVWVFWLPCEMFGMGLIISHGNKSYLSEAGHSCNGRLSWYWLLFREQFAHCATAVHMSLTVISQKYSRRTVSYIPHRSEWLRLKGNERDVGYVDVSMATGRFVLLRPQGNNSWLDASCRC